MRLRALEEEESWAKLLLPEGPAARPYALTKEGLALLPIIEDMRSYGRRSLTASCAEDASGG